MDDSFRSISSFIISYLNFHQQARSGFTRFTKYIRVPYILLVYSVCCKEMAKMKRPHTLNRRILLLITRRCNGNIYLVSCAVCAKKTNKENKKWRTKEIKQARSECWIYFFVAHIINWLHPNTMPVEYYDFSYIQFITIVMTMHVM